MGSFSGLGIGLSFLVGCFLMGVVAQLYYSLWWKKRTATTSDTEIQGFSFIFCWKRTKSFKRYSSNQELTNSVRNHPSDTEDIEMGTSKKLGLKGCGEGGVDLELMRMHDLCGPPRFLFTIKEESKEDLESEDGKSRSSIKGSRTSKSLSDLVFAGDGTPLPSPTVKASILSDSYNNHGFNPLFESLTAAEINRLRSSPPPKFKFLKDAEDKLIRRLLMEEAERSRGVRNEGLAQESAIKDVSFVKFSNQAAQMLPLASPPTLRPVLDNN